MNQVCCVYYWEYMQDVSYLQMAPFEYFCIMYASVVGNTYYTKSESHVCKQSNGDGLFYSRTYS